MKHQSISKWLSQLGLPQYCLALEQEYDGVEDLLHISEYDLLELGVHSHLHRLHLLTSLRLLQERERRKAGSDAQSTQYEPGSAWRTTIQLREEKNEQRSSGGEEVTLAGRNENLSVELSIHHTIDTTAKSSVSALSPGSAGTAACPRPLLQPASLSPYTEPCHGVRKGSVTLTGTTPGSPEPVIRRHASINLRLPRWSKTATARVTVTGKQTRAGHLERD
ncbi:unnamed protein product [Tetraodon nigroviridis]|uniref:(spotted green pufferfish) hypothetical protein n=1 Tax=Tetraodon nigroviridis TaxID=99883 RepID=Q4S6Q6_TETNG|nr:unnamed protein product [Tetraodon nigroviridis]